jgi:hypothetical protein
LLSKTDSNALISQSVSKSGVQTYSIYALGVAGFYKWARDALIRWKFDMQDHFAIRQLAHIQV